MAKKKGSGSNLGLIITLVFFVLATVILGVTTYMGFSAQEEKDKAVAKMKQEKDVAENDSKWHRYQSRYLRGIIGRPPAGVDAADVAREKQQFDAGQLPFANNQKDKDDFAKLSKDLNEKLPWDASKATAPSRTFEQWVAQKDQEIDGIKGRLKKAEDSAAREKREKEDAETAAQKEIASLKSALDDVRNKALTDRKKDLEDIASKSDTLRKDGESLADLRRRLDAAVKDLDKQTALAKKLTSELATAKKETRELRDSLDENRTRLAALLERTGQDPRAVEQAVLDARSSQILREWNRDWHIVDLDRRGTMPYINLGTADSVAPQVTFSIHAMTADGKLNPTAKGTLEVVRVIGSHLAQARITSVKDPKQDPILKGDRLFNPTWDPTRKKHVAIAGMADIGGDGSFNTEDLRRLLAKQNVEIDAFIDTKDEKTPKIGGSGITVNTDYLILADPLDGVNHPRSRDKAYTAAFDKLMREMRDKAAANGVHVIGLRRYLEMIGYRAPKIASGTSY
ncbi:MAG: hypothetical protein U0840_10825 [Gemmataceae bacterium]